MAEINIKFTEEQLQEIKGHVNKQVEDIKNHFVGHDKINKAIEDIKECSFTATLHSDDYFMGIDKVEFVRLDTVLMILNKLMENGD